MTMNRVSVGQGEHAVGDLLQRLARDRGAAVVAVGLSDPRPQEAQVVVDLGHRPDRGARVARGRLLVDRDRRAQALDRVHVGLLHLAQELACVGGQRLDVAALALRVDRVEGEARLARAREPRDHDQRVARQLEVDALEVVRSGAGDGYLVREGHRGQCLRGRTGVPVARVVHVRARVVSARARSAPGQRHLRAGARGLGPRGRPPFLPRPARLRGDPVRRGTRRSLWYLIGSSARLGLWTPQVGLAGGRGGAHVHFAFQLEREALDPLLERLRAAGVEVEGPIQLGADRAIYVTDPDGNVVEFWTQDMAEYPGAPAAAPAPSAARLAPGWRLSTVYGPKAPTERRLPAGLRVDLVQQRVEVGDLVVGGELLRAPSRARSRRGPASSPPAAPRRHRRWRLVEAPGRWLRLGVRRLLGSGLQPLRTFSSSVETSAAPAPPPRAPSAQARGLALRRRGLAPSPASSCSSAWPHLVEPLAGLRLGPAADPLRLRLGLAHDLVRPPLRCLQRSAHAVDCLLDQVLGIHGASEVTPRRSLA